MKNSFVAFFDILGFKNLVENNNHKDLIELYEDALYTTLDLTDKHYDPIYSSITPLSELNSLNIKTFVISDSIILVQEDMTQRGLLNLISKCQVLLSSTIADGIPLRGAISFGPVSIMENKRGTTIVGRGLTKAYSLEADQQWSGGIIDPECFDVFPEESGNSIISRLLGDVKNPLIISYEVPFKGNIFRYGYGFNWPSYDLLKDEDNVRDAFTRHKKQVPSVKEQSIIDHTVAYYKHVKDLLTK